MLGEGQALSAAHQAHVHTPAGVVTAPLTDVLRAQYADLSRQSTVDYLPVLTTRRDRVRNMHCTSLNSLDAAGTPLQHYNQQSPSESIQEEGQE